MKVVSKKTNNLFEFGKTYDVERVGLLLKFTINDDVYYGDYYEFYTIEEWRELQLNKIFTNE
jgi:hypothetical protein